MNIDRSKLVSFGFTILILLVVLGVGAIVLDKMQDRYNSWESELNEKCGDLKPNTSFEVIHPTDGYMYCDFKDGSKWTLPYIKEKTEPAMPLGHYLQIIGLAFLLSLVILFIRVCRGDRNES